MQSTRIRNSILNKKHFTVKSAAGTIQFMHPTFVDIFRPKVGKIKYIILPTLRPFDGIVGNDTFK